MNYNTPFQRKTDIHDFERKKPPLPTYISERKTPVLNDDKFLSKSPKEEYNFQNKIINRCNSTGKVLLKQYKENINSMNTIVRKDSNNDRSNVGSRDNSYMTQQNNISKISNASSVSQYLDKRHQDAQRKITHLRNEKYQKEIGNYGFKPRISDASKKIISKLSRQESPMRIDSNRQEYTNENNAYEPYIEKEKFENLLRNGKIKREDEYEKNRRIEVGSNYSLNPDSQRKKNHSISTITRSNSKSNVSKKLSKTIEELNDYKKMIEKREIIMQEEKMKEIEKERERARILESAGIKKRPVSAISYNKTDYINNTTLGNQKQFTTQQNYTPVNTNFKTISNSNNISNTSTNRNHQVPLSSGNVSKLSNCDPYSNPQFHTQKNFVMMNTLKLNSDRERDRHADINIGSNKYYDYNPEKVIDARRGLNEYLIERKEKTILSNLSNIGNNNRSILSTKEQTSNFNNIQLNRNNFSNTPLLARPNLQSHVPFFNEENQPKKLFDLKIGNQTNIRNQEDFNQNKNFQENNKDRIVTGNFSYNTGYNTGTKLGKSNLAPSSIDFNQLDQFSPPNNNNVNVITYEIQKAYQNNLIREKSGSTHNNQNNTSSYNSINQTFGSGPHQRSHSAVPKSREDSFSNTNKRKEDLDYFKNYIDKIKTDKPKESENTFKDSSPTFNSEKHSQKSVATINTINTINTGNTVKMEKNVTSEIYKLNPSSKNYALEKMLEMKARAGNNFS